MQDSSPIVVFTAYSYPQMKTFYRYQTRAVWRLTLYLGIIVLVFYASMFQNVRAGVVSTGAVLTTLPIPVLIMALLAGFASGIFYTPKAWAKSSKTVKDGQTCTFYADRFEVESFGEENTHQSSSAYTLLHQVVETRTLFFLYVNPTNAVLVDKEGFKNGDPAELRRLLTQQLPPKKLKLKP